MEIIIDETSHIGIMLGGSYINTIILGIPNRFISSATIMLNIAYNEV